MKKNYPLELLATLLAKGISPASPKGHKWAMRPYIRGYFTQGYDSPIAREAHARTQTTAVDAVIERAKQEIRSLKKFPIYVSLIEVRDGDHEYSSKDFFTAKNQADAEAKVRSELLATFDENFSELEPDVFQESPGYRIHTIERVSRLDSISDLMGELSI